MRQKAQLIVGLLAVIGIVVLTLRNCSLGPDAPDKIYPPGTPGAQLHIPVDLGWGNLDIPNERPNQEAVFRRRLEVYTSSAVRALAGHATDYAHSNGVLKDAERSLYHKELEEGVAGQFMHPGREVFAEVMAKKSDDHLLRIQSEISQLVSFYNAIPETESDWDALLAKKEEFMKLYEKTEAFKRSLGIDE